jgi:hypothetical protein
MIASDVMVFAGVDPDQAQYAMRDDTGDLEVPTPAPTPRVPFNVSHWRPTP